MIGHLLVGRVILRFHNNLLSLQDKETHTQPIWREMNGKYAKLKDAHLIEIEIHGTPVGG